jgi:hypothetical protein
LEINCHRYIQLTNEEFQKLVANKVLYPNMIGYEYINDSGINMVEFHVDDHNYFEKIQSDLIFGASLSVRKPTNIKPVIIF